MNKFKSFWTQDESGQAMSEYTLLIAIIGIFLVGAAILFRDSIAALFGRATTALDAAGT